LQISKVVACLDGIRHALDTGMENTVHTAEGPSETAIEASIATATQQPLLQISEKPGEGKGSDPECTEIVPSLRTQIFQDGEFLVAGAPALPEHLRQIPFRLELRVPLSRFTLRDLQNLQPGALLATEHLASGCCWWNLKQWSSRWRRGSSASHGGINGGGRHDIPPGMVKQAPRYCPH
jgi:hypothetical protein